MEIHAPEAPVHGFKDFLIHISIVTLGILIALGLEGLREAIHNRHLVRETRESVYQEMTRNLQAADRECASVHAFTQQMNTVASQLPALLQQPLLLQARVNAAQNSGYFLAVNSWQAALSTGALAHMPTAEVATYAMAADGARRYSEMQLQAENQEVETKALLDAQSGDANGNKQPAAQAVLLLLRQEQALDFVCPQVRKDFASAYRASAP